MRADKALVEAGLSPTRSQSSQLIERGCVYYGEQLVEKPSQKITDLNMLRLEAAQIYVGRGAFKLIEAQKYFDLNFDSLVAADVGASTGGFTQVLLEGGAKKVYAIDVGQDQLDVSLKQDERVVNLEKTNIRDFPENIKLQEDVDFVVCDLSFISLKLCLRAIASLFGNKDRGVLIALVKPQFEVGRNFLGKNGIVKDEDAVFGCLEDICATAAEENFEFHNACLSPITGKAGNKEFLFYFTKKISDHDGRSGALSLKKQNMEKWTKIAPQLSLKWREVV